MKNYSDEGLNEMDEKKNAVLRQIGAKVAYYRTLRRMTQAELAEKVHMSSSSIGRIERGTYNNGAPISTLLDVADGLGVELASLVTFNDTEEKIFRDSNKNFV